LFFYQHFLKAPLSVESGKGLPCSIRDRPSPIIAKNQGKKRRLGRLWPATS
jgi:hypothetical protein